MDFISWREAINRNKNSEEILDIAAFSLLFRFIAGNQDVEAKKRIRSYVKQIGLGKCKTCSVEANKDRGTEQDLNALIEAADEFQRRVSVLDLQAVKIKRNNQPSPQVTAELKQLQLQKEAVVAEIVASLPYKLTKTGMDKIRQHVTERVKKNSTLKAEQDSASLFNQAEQSDQSEFTDSYTIEQSQPQPSTDPETGEQTNTFSENTTPTQVVGVGVTESSYDSDIYMVDTYTTIAAPSGAVISQSSVVTGDTYARAETIAELDSETAEEGDYTVQSRHRYKHFSDGVEPVAGYEVLKQPVRKKGSFSHQIASNLCYGCGGYYYSTNFTFRFISVYLQTEAFIRDTYLDSLCRRTYEGAFNYAYYPLCRISGLNPCRNQVILCGTQSTPGYVAAYTEVITIYGYRFCPITRFVYTNQQPPCINTRR